MLPSAMSTSWGPDDPRRRQAVPGDSWVDRTYRRTGEAPKRRDWADLILRPEPDEQPPPAPLEAGPCWSQPSAEQEVHQVQARKRRHAVLVPPRPVGKPARSRDGLSPAARKVAASLPPGSWKPPSKRAGQRSKGRNIPTPTEPVDPIRVLFALQRNWEGADGRTWQWRRRGLVILAAALAVPRGTTIERFRSMTPVEILRLRMPHPAWKQVVRWLEIHRSIYGSEADSLPWLAVPGSNAMPRSISWAASRTLQRAGMPGWRLGALLRATWIGHAAVPLAAVRSYFVGAGSPLRGSLPRWRT